MPTLWTNGQKHAAKKVMSCSELCFATVIAALPVHSLWYCLPLSVAMFSR